MLGTVMLRLFKTSPTLPPSNSLTPATLFYLAI